MESNHQARIDRLLARHPDAVISGDAIHRRNQILVPIHQSDFAAKRCARFLERVEPFDEIGVCRLWLRASGDVDMPALVHELREAGLDASPNHILHGEAEYLGGPVKAPVAIDEIPAPVATGTGRRIKVAVLDTGITPHPWFTSADWWSRVEPDQIDPISTGSDYDLGTQSGHGTLAAGILLEEAPDAELWIERVLDDIGVCDEIELIQGLHRVLRRENETGTRVDVINLSLGGYTHGDRAPTLLTQTLRKFGQHSVIVAAAGNNASERYFWPAALKDCVAVCAKTHFSNRGSWVDAHARGEDVTGPFAQRTSDDEIELGFARWSGTSFAASHAAGAIARTANEKDITARQAAEILLDINGPVIDDEFGHEIDSSAGLYRDRYRLGEREVPSSATHMDGGRNPLNDTLDVAVYLANADDEAVARQAIADFIAAIGGEITEETDPVRGSLWWTAKAKKKAAEVGETAALVGEALAWSPVHTRAAANNLTNSQAVETLMRAIEPLDDCALQIGSFLAVKNNRTAVIITLSQAQINELERRPDIMRTPGTVLEDLGRLMAGSSPDDHTRS